MSLLQMSFSGAILILAIIVVRAATVRRLPKKVFLILWYMALFRLLIPFSIPSALSAYSLMRGNSSVDLFSETPMENMFPEARREQGADRPRPVRYPEGAQTGQRLPVYPLIWCVGMLFLAACFAALYLRWLWKFREAAPVHNRFVREWLAAHRRKRPISIRQSDQIDAPLTYGVWRPVILMPAGTDWEDTDRLEYILLHEYIHISRYDTVTKLLFTFALCVHWFNPFVWMMYFLLNRDLELACDESVVRRFGISSRSAYANVLIDMEAKKSGLPSFYSGFSKNAIEKRIAAIMKTRKATIGISVVCVLIVTALAVFFVTSGQTKTQNADARTDTESDRDAQADREVQAGTGGQTDVDARTDTESDRDAQTGMGIQNDTYVIEAFLESAPFFYVSDELATPEKITLEEVPALFDANDNYMKIWSFAAYRANYRSFVNLKTDGTYYGSDMTGSAESGICVITGFTETGYTIDKMTYGSGGAGGLNTFVVDHQPAVEEDFRLALSKQDQKEDALWYDFSEYAPATSAESNVSETVPPETFPVGTYYRYEAAEGDRDKVSELIISYDGAGKYTVSFGLYKIMYVSNAAGSYDSDSGILSFTGVDDMGHAFSADVAIQGEELIVILTHFEYSDKIRRYPEGTALSFQAAEGAGS